MHGDRRIDKTQIVVENKKTTADELIERDIFSVSEQSAAEATEAEASP